MVSIRLVGKMRRFAVKQLLLTLFQAGIVCRLHCTGTSRAVWIFYERAGVYFVHVGAVKTQNLQLFSQGN